MSPMLSKLINVMVINFASILITRKVTNISIKLFTLRNIMWFLISLLPVVMFYSENYNFTTVLAFLFLILALKKIFDVDISISAILSLEIMIISIIPDLLCSAIMINFMSFEEMRNDFIVMFLNNTIISLSTYLIFNIKFINTITRNTIEKVKRPEKRKIIIYCLFAFIAICIAYYMASNLFTPTKDYFVVNVVIIVFIIMIFVYMSEIIKYDKLLTQNNTLYECMKNVEDYQEKQDLKIHEYKNQLSKIIALTKDKQVIDMLEKILQVDLTTDNYILGQLKYIPKGDIKSLIYYKLLVANKKGLKTYIDISPKLDLKIINLSINLREELTQLLGIYFDNAIESAFLSKGKEISLETYEAKGNIVFVIMNTYKGKIKLNDLCKKNFTTKGPGRGKGLYFANKILTHSQIFKSKSQVLKKYFVQRLEIKKE